MSAIAKCPISGKEIEVPVYCTKTKMIYDKKEIERCISEHGKYPITNIEISSDDIIEVNTNKNTNETLEMAKAINKLDDILSEFILRYYLVKFYPQNNK